MKKVIFSLLFLLSQVSYGQWEAVNNGFINPIFIEQLGVKNNLLFAGTQYFGVYLSSDFGETWMQKNTGLIGDIGLITDIDLESVVRNLEIQGDNIWIKTRHLGENGATYNIFMSSNNGDTWVLKNSDLPRNNSGGVYVSNIRVNGDSIFVVDNLESGIHLSTNNGDHWEQVFSPLISVADDIFFGKNCLFLYSKHHVMRSTDNGASWEIKENGLDLTQLFFLNIKGDTLFAGFWGRGIYRSTDLGETWEAKNSGLTMRDPRCCLIKDDIIIIGTSAMYGPEGGVYVSTDGGENWVQKSSGLTNLWVTDLETIGDYIFASTQDGGVFRAKLSDLTTDVKESEQASSNSIYPNPARDIINAADYLGWEYQMYDLLGNNVQTGLVNSENINISNLSAGFYTIRFFKEGKQEVKKLIKV
ncbi:MAG: T9SS type A sorting domain-containing protein [Chloroherpetonaceae bacterium]